jgi:hypothetical protein
MFAIEIAFLIAMLLYDAHESNPTTGTAVLLTIYFAGVACLIYFFFRIYRRLWQIRREAVLLVQNFGEKHQQ